MIDPYLPVTELEIFQRKYFEYFRSLCHHARNKSLNGKQVSYLSYFASHPISSAYDIEPGSKINHSNYRNAKLVLKKLHELRLIRLMKSEKAKRKGKHPSKKYSLTDLGIIYLVSRTNIIRADLLQELFKNYHNLKIFLYLVYPFMNLETLCSPRLELHFLEGVRKYLVNLIQRMDMKVSSFEKMDRSDREIYFWNYNRLEDYLRDKYHYDFVDYLSSEEDFDDSHYEIRYFDEKNKNNYVIIKFDKKNKKGYILRKNRRINSYEIPLITDYITKKVIPYNQNMARDFHAFCGPKVEEFVLSVFPFFKVVSEENIRNLLLTDRPFRNALKRTKHTFDVWYNKIMSFPNFSF